MALTTELWWWQECPFTNKQTWCKLEMNLRCKLINKLSFTLELLSYKRKKKRQIKESEKLRENLYLLLICMIWKHRKWLHNNNLEQTLWLRRRTIEWKSELIDKMSQIISPVINRVYSQWIKIPVTSLDKSQIISETISIRREQNLWWIRNLTSSKSTIWKQRLLKTELPIMLCITQKVLIYITEESMRLKMLLVMSTVSLNSLSSKRPT
jgi:hypothetical protein